MADTRLRNLDRLVAQGDLQALGALLRESARAGRIERARFATYLAQLSGQVDLLQWAVGLGDFEKQVRVRVAAAACQAVGWHYPVAEDWLCEPTKSEAEELEYTATLMTLEELWEAGDSGATKERKQLLVGVEHWAAEAAGCCYSNEGCCQSASAVVGAVNLANGLVGESALVRAVLADLVTWLFGGDPVGARMEARGGARAMKLRLRLTGGQSGARQAPR